MQAQGDKGARMLAPTLGMSFLWLYCRAYYLSFLTTEATHTVEAGQAAHIAHSLVFAAAAVLAVAAAPRVRRLAANDRAISALALGGALGNLMMWLPYPPAAEGALCALGAGMAMAAFAPLLIRYGMALDGLGARRATGVCFASFGLCFASNAVYFLPLFAQAAFCTLAPLVAVACLPRSSADAACGHKPPEASAETSLTGTTVALMVLLALFCLTGNFVRGVTSPWFDYETSALRSFTMSLVNIVFVAVSLALLLRSSVSVEKILFGNWVAYMLLFFAGLLTLTFMTGTAASLGSDIVTVSRVGFTLLMFLFALRSAQWTQRDPVRLVGLFLLVPEAVSSLVRFVAVPLILQGTSVATSAFVSYAGIAILFVLIVAILMCLGNVLLRQMGAGFAPSGQEPSKPLQAIGEQALEIVARDYLLTARETQTASYVSGGYSLEKTAELMGVSINTVRTHIRSVYAKLGIHARQELIDMLDEVKASLANRPADN